MTFGIKAMLAFTLLAATFTWGVKVGHEDMEAVKNRVRALENSRDIHLDIIEVHTDKWMELEKAIGIKYDEYGVKIPAGTSTGDAEVE